MTGVEDRGYNTLRKQFKNHEYKFQELWDKIRKENLRILRGVDKKERHRKNPFIGKEIPQTREGKLFK